MQQSLLASVRKNEDPSNTARESQHNFRTYHEEQSSHDAPANADKAIKPALTVAKQCKETLLGKEWRTKRSGKRPTNDSSYCKPEDAMRSL